MVSTNVVKRIFRWQLLAVGLAIFVASALTNSVHAASAGSNYNWGPIFIIPPGGVLATYQGNYSGLNAWTTGSTNFFYYHKSSVLVDNSTDVFNPSTKHRVHHNGKFIFEIPNSAWGGTWSIPSGWWHLGGHTTGYTWGFSSSGSTAHTDASWSFSLCNYSHCYNGIISKPTWTLW